MEYTIYILIGIVVIIAICLAIANNASAYFTKKYKKYNQILLDKPYNAGDFAITLVNNSNYNNLNIAYTENELADAYYSKTNTIVLSTTTLESSSIASFAIVAHEFGHAIQKNSGNIRYGFLNCLKHISAFIGNFSFPLMIIGLIIALIGINVVLGKYILIAGAVIFIISLLTDLLTIPIEFEASNLGLQKLKEYNFMTNKELKIARKFLKSAGFTYVGAFLSRIFAWTFLVPKYKK